MKNVLVIGGAGYIGSVLSTMLVEQGFQTTVFDSLIFGDRPLAHLRGKPGFRLIKGDLRNITAVSEAVQGHDAGRPAGGSGRGARLRPGS